MVTGQRLNALTWLEISKTALVHNLRQFKRILRVGEQHASPEPSRRGRAPLLMAVVKSNAYGHGLVEVARVAERHGVNWLCTAGLDEALTLRHAKLRKPILVLSYWPFDRALVSQAVRQGIRLVVANFEQLQFLQELGRRLKRTIPVHLKIDVGTSRIGFLPGQIPFLVPLIKGVGGSDRSVTHNRRTPLLGGTVKIEGIFSHFARAEEEDQSSTKRQLQVFNAVVDQLAEQGIRPSIRHIACTAGILTNPDNHLNAVRLGIGLYGLWSLEDGRAGLKRRYPWFNLKPALTWKTRVIAVRDLPKGSAIGYSGTFIAKRETRIATLSIGYWDGYDRRLSNNAEVLIHGRRCPVRGRVCMNLTMVEVPKGLRVRVGDEVVLIGKQGKQEVTADELAKRMGTINYEVVTKVNPILSRIAI